MQTVHVRVNDAATGKPTPCRVRFTDAAGKYYAPLGRLSDFPRGITHGAEGNVYDGDEKWAYIDGTCEIQLPQGSITVQARKGFEYTPVNTIVELVPGKLALRFTLERWIDMRQKGWYSGDGRVHNLTPHEALLQAAGEDLAVVNLLVEENAGSMANITAFSGQQPCLEMPGHIVAVNTHNVHAELGSLALLHCHRVVYPLRIGGEDGQRWTLADWCNQCHRKEGLVVWTGDSSRHDPAGLPLGKINALEISNRNFSALAKFPRTGFRLAFVGASGSRDNEQLLGWPRTYCLLQPGESLTYRSWIEAVRAGRTFVTFGPIIVFAVNGQPPGSVVEIRKGERTVAVTVEIISPIPFEIVSLGSSIWYDHASPEYDHLTWHARITADVPVAETDQLNVFCTRPRPRPDRLVNLPSAEMVKTFLEYAEPASQPFLAISSPVYVVHAAG